LVGIQNLSNVSIPVPILCSPIIPATVSRLLELVEKEEEEEEEKIEKTLP
jgi:hypothetical protein